MFDLYTVLSLVPSFVRTQDKQIFLLVAAPKTYKQNPISRLKEVNLKIHIFSSKAITNCSCILHMHMCSCCYRPLFPSVRPYTSPQVLTFHYSCTHKNKVLYRKWNTFHLVFDKFCTLTCFTSNAVIAYYFFCGHFLPFLVYIYIYFLVFNNLFTLSSVVLNSLFFFHLSLTTFRIRIRPDWNSVMYHVSKNNMYLKSKIIFLFFTCSLPNL